MKIGVFDSGRGGTYIAQGLRTLLPSDSFVVVNDAAHVPYGSRSNEEVVALTERAIAPLLVDCPIIVIACNTASMAGINVLRARYPDTKFVGIEPMIKPARTVSVSQHITVMATPLTLSSERYRKLVADFGGSLQIDQPATSRWARMIEDDQADAIVLDDVRSSVASGSDTLVLACTHYLALIKRLQQTFPEVTILEPTEAVARQVQRLKVELQTRQ